MKIKVRSLATGKKIKPMLGTEFLLTAKGEVLVNNCLTYVGGTNELFVDGGYVVEFAFSRGVDGKWQYQNCVVNE